MRRQKILRWTILFMTLAALFAVVGCSSGPEPGSDTARFPVPTEIVPAISTPAPTSTPVATPSPEPSPVPTPTAAAAPAATNPSPEPSPASESKESGAGRLPAPDFTLPSASGGSVTLTGLLEDSKGVVLVFYRGFF